MSNFELNMAIAEALGVKIPTGEQIKTNNFLKRRGDMLFRVGDGGTYETAIFLDYCNNWNDLMPLVVEYGINFWNYSKDHNIREGEEFCGAELITQIEVFNKNPQRAPAECLLKVLEAK